MYDTNQYIFNGTSILLSQLLSLLKMGINIANVTGVLSSNSTNISITSQSGDYLITILAKQSISEVIKVSANDGKVYEIKVMGS